MSTDSTTRKSRGKRKKPAKPSPDFPLFPHGNGQWAKKIGGKLYYFGPWDDPAGALATWKAYDGNGLPRRDSDDVTIGDVTDSYYESQKLRFEQGEIAQQTLNDNARVCRRLVKFLGVATPVDSIRPERFAKFRKHLSETLAPTSLRIEIVRVKAVFKYSYESEMIDRLPRYGRDFKPPAQKSIRKQNNRRGEQMFEAVEIHKLLVGADPTLTAFVLLGINAGFGNRDCALLTKDAVDLKNGVIEFPRPKTAVMRRVVLWPETVKALKAVAAVRPESAIPENDELFFVTSRGECWVRNSAPGEGLFHGKKRERTHSWIDSLGTAFRKWTDKNKLTLPGRGFYGLRRSFLTIADEVRDNAAVDLIMGHAADKGDMRQHYRQRISDQRLRVVTNHVRKWLFKKDASKKK